MIKRWLRVSPSIPQLHSQDDGRLLAALNADGTVRLYCTMLSVTEAAGLGAWMVMLFGEEEERQALHLVWQRR